MIGQSSIGFLKAKLTTCRRENITNILDVFQTFFFLVERRISD